MNHHYPPFIAMTTPLTPIKSYKIPRKSHILTCESPTTSSSKVYELRTDRGPAVAAHQAPHGSHLGIHEIFGGKHMILIGIYWDLVRFNGDLIGAYWDLMGGI